jgi:hypothetical protein
VVGSKRKRSDSDVTVGYLGAQDGKVEVMDELLQNISLEKICKRHKAFAQTLVSVIEKQEPFTRACILNKLQKDANRCSNDLQRDKLVIDVMSWELLQAWNRNAKADRKARLDLAAESWKTAYATHSLRQESCRKRIVSFMNSDIISH